MLKDFLSIESNSIEDDLKASLKIEAFDLDKEKLNIKIVEQLNPPTINPCEYKGIYTEYKNNTFPLIFEKQIARKENAQNHSYSIILKYKNLNNQNYVIKRSIKQIINLDSAESKEDLEKFIRSNYREYSIKKLYSLFPYCIKPLEINFVYLLNYSYFIIDILMDYGGQTLKDFIDHNSISDHFIFQIFSQLIMAIKYLEIFNIQHNDIKPENIIINLSNENCILKLIDFGVANTVQAITDTEFIEQEGISMIFDSPEKQILFIDKNMMIDPNLCQIYSFGITVLYMLQFFSTIISLSDFQILQKMDTNENSIYLNECLDKFYGMLEKSEIRRKIFIVCRECISSDPNYRLNSKELFFLLQGLELKSIEKIQIEIKSIKDKKYYLRFLKTNQNELFDIIEKISSKIKMQTFIFKSDGNYFESKNKTHYSNYEMLL